MTVAGLCIPVNGAGNRAAELGAREMTRTVLVTAGREYLTDQVIDYGSGAIVGRIAAGANLSQTETVLLNMGASMLGDHAVDGLGSFISSRTGNVRADFVEGMSYEDAIQYNRYMDECIAGTHNPYPGMTEADVARWQLADLRNTEHMAVSRVDVEQYTGLRAQEAQLRGMGEVNVPTSVMADGVGNGIESGADVIDTRNINGHRTSRYRQLSDDEISQLLDDIEALEADPSIFRFNEGNQTGFLDSEGIINVRGDVLPDVNSNHPRDLMSPRAVLAHEYYGHKHFDDVFGVRNPLPGSWNDEFRASYNAALNAPNLSDMDRMYLMLDALERAKEAGVNITITDEIRRILYGY